MLKKRIRLFYYYSTDLRDYRNPLSLSESPARVPLHSLPESLRVCVTVDDSLHFRESIQTMSIRKLLKREKDTFFYSESGYREVSNKLIVLSFAYNQENKQ